MCRELILHSMQACALGGLRVLDDELEQRLAHAIRASPATRQARREVGGTIERPI